MSKLYLVATPIGNLKDITLRAIETLKLVDVIACEDTRHTLRLLNHLQIKKKLISYHQHNEREAAQKICDMLQEGKSVALVSDAGMPCISDPGAILVKECTAQGFQVESVPGVSAITTALSLSGIELSGFLFLGFMPLKQGDKVRFLSKYKGVDVPLVFYVAPHDLKSDARVLKDVLGDRQVWVAKELTKLHQNIKVCNLSDIQNLEPKGEYVLIVEGNKLQDNFQDVSIEAHLSALIECGKSEKDAIKEVAKLRGLSKNQVYQEAIRMKLDRDKKL